MGNYFKGENKELEVSFVPEVRELDKIGILKIIVKFIIFIITIIIIMKKEDKIEDKKEDDSINFTSTGINEYTYVKKGFYSVLDNLPLYDNTHKTSKTIFWCWLQGLENAPKLYLSCLNSIRQNCQGYKIIIITNETMHNYVHFPDYILEKYKNNYISPTHFSDLLRLELLIKYGGTWIDASVLISKFDERFFDKDLFFFQQRTAGCVGSSWFITAEKASPILISTRDLLYEYWRKRNDLCNYFLFHLFIRLSFEKYEKMLNNIPYFSNEPPHNLQHVLTHEYSETEYNNILKNISVHKLTVKCGEAPKNSFFNHIIDVYYPKNNTINY